MLSNTWLVVKLKLKMIISQQQNYYFETVKQDKKLKKNDWKKLNRNLKQVLIILKNKFT